MLSGVVWPIEKKEKERVYLVEKGGEKKSRRYVDVWTTQACGVLSSLWRQPPELAAPTSISESDDADHGHTAVVQLTSAERPCFLRCHVRVSVCDGFKVPPLVDPTGQRPAFTFAAATK